MKVLSFKFVTTMLFLLLTLFAAGFTAKAAPDAFAQPETVSVQQTVNADSLGGEFVIMNEADDTIPS